MKRLFRRRRRCLDAQLMLSVQRRAICALQQQLAAQRETDGHLARRLDQQFDALMVLEARISDLEAQLCARTDDA